MHSNPRKMARCSWLRATLLVLCALLALASLHTCSAQDPAAARDALSRPRRPGRADGASSALRRTQRRTNATTNFDASAATSSKPAIGDHVEAEADRFDDFIAGLPPKKRQRHAAYCQRLLATSGDDSSAAVPATRTGKRVGGARLPFEYFIVPSGRAGLGDILERAGMRVRALPSSHPHFPALSPCNC